MLGSAIRNCQANGTWDGQETTCEGNNNIEIFNKNTTFFNFPDMFRRYIRHRSVTVKITTVGYIILR